MRAAFVVTDRPAAVMGAAVRAAPELKVDLPDWRKTPVIDQDLGHGIHMLESFGANIGLGGEYGSAAGACTQQPRVTRPALDCAGTEHPVCGIRRAESAATPGHREAQDAAVPDRARSVRQVSSAGSRGRGHLHR
jgi:hypothetical protein